MERQPTTQKKLVTDLLVPIGEVNSHEIASCFGKMWDISARECHQCSDRDTCGIIFQQKVNAKAKEIEAKVGTPFLDTVTFCKITPELVKEKIQNEAPIQDLIDLVIKTSNCEDMPSVVNFLKQFIKDNDFIKTKDGKVWLNY